MSWYLLIYIKINLHYPACSNIYYFILTYNYIFCLFGLYCVIGIKLFPFICNLLFTSILFGVCLSFDFVLLYNKNKL